MISATGTYIGTLKQGGVPAAFGPHGLVAFVDGGELDIPIITVQRLTLTPGS